MKLKTALLLSVVLSTVAVSSGVGFAATSGFSDVPQSYPYSEAIIDLARRGIIQGYPDGTFRPDQAVNRVEALKIILLGSGIAVTEIHTNAGFADVEANSWYSRYVVKAKELGIIQGYPDGTFRPAKTLNLVENLKILLLTKKVDVSHIDANMKFYNDAVANSWYSKYLNYAHDKNLIDAGSGNNVYPDQPMTRGKLAESMHRFIYIQEHQLDYFGQDTGVSKPSNTPLPPAPAPVPSPTPSPTPAPVPGPSPVPVVTTDHPRLLFTQNDVSRLRSWAVAANPIYESGLKLVAEKAKDTMDKGLVPNDDGGGYGYASYPNEEYAELFAFMSLVSPDESERQDYAKRAHTLLMYVMNKAVLGIDDSQPFRGANFSTSNRSRWFGEAFPLTVDWIYHVLTANDKTTIRKVFLRWADENMNAEITTDNHPVPVGVVDDPALLSDSKRVRWSANNYFTAHMRNIGLMALVFDSSDDPDSKLRNYLKNATGAWLYMTDHFMRTDGKGGLPPEGFEYSPQAMGYVAQLLLAIHTAGMDNANIYGQQVVLKNNPWWSDSVSAFLHSINPGDGKAPADSNDAWMGKLYQMASYGDLAHYWVPDFIGIYGPLGIYDDSTGNVAELQKIRWIQTNTPPGGAEKLNYRIGSSDNFFDSILYFMLFDPSGSSPADPRGNESLYFFAEGLGRIFARTDWSSTANWFTYKLGWNTIDHQHADGNMFEFWRKGEWLTKERSGYGDNVGSSDYKNSLAVQNDAPSHNDPGAYRNVNWLRGSQWLYVNDGAGKILAHSYGDGYTYVLGDATDLYNSTYEGATDVTHVSRSMVWLNPDHIVVYDRAATKTAGRFKRFWLNLPFIGTVVNKLMTMVTASGQKLYVTNLLPTDAIVKVEPAESLVSDNGKEVADMDPIKYRLKVEAPNGPTDVRFLNVLQGADAGTNVDTATLIQSTQGTPYAGVLVHAIAVLFPVDVATPVSNITYNVSTQAIKNLVTGLLPKSGYSINKVLSGDHFQITITPGGTSMTDDGGVLVIQ